MKPDLTKTYTDFLNNELSADGIKKLFSEIDQLTAPEIGVMVEEVLDEKDTDAVDGEEDRLNKILASIQQQRFAKVVPLAGQIRKYWRFASAAAILIVVATYIIIFSHQPNHDRISIARGSSDILPGKNKAVLRLADGTELDLDSIGKGEEAILQYGASISKNSKGELIYNTVKESSPETRVEFNTINTPRGGKYKVILPDSTQVWLNASSSITYPTSFARAAVRNVKLTGEAYFEVKTLKDESGIKQPFVVSTDRQEIKVLGTHFNVNAYADELQMKTTLLQGLVELNGRTILHPGEQGISEGREMVVRSVNAAAFIDWKTGDFNLKDSDFKTTMRKIARWYDVDIIYSPSAPGNVKIGGWISREKNISSVLNLIQKTGEVHFKIEGRRVIVIR